MVSQDDFPDKWACESDQKQVKVEIRVPDDPDAIDDALGEIADLIDVAGLPFGGIEPATDYTWIEIPTTEVEQWTRKGSAASIQRTAKVKFPGTWGQTPPGGLHNSPRRLLTGFSGDEDHPFMLARISFKSQADNWVFTHFGWIGGSGPASQTGMHKFWVYDFAEFWEAAPVGVTFDHPTLEQVVGQITEIVRKNTMTPLEQYDVIPPQTEEELSEIITSDDITAGDDIAFALARGEDGNISLPYYSQSEVDTNPGAVIPGDKSAKSFQANRHTIRDVVKWFEKKTNSKLHYEPLAEGGEIDSVQLTADIVPSRRTFVHDDVVINEGFWDAHGIVELFDNSALYEIKPFNTVHLRGAYVEQGATDYPVDIPGTGGIESFPSELSTPGKAYPVVKVQVPSLLSAAEGAQVSGPVVESEAKSLDDAEQQARTEMRKRLEGQSEGEILSWGAPRLMPYDKLVAYEVCGDLVEYEPEPVEYEIEEVKHTASASEVYQTRLRASVFIDDEDIVTVEKRWEEA